MAKEFSGEYYDEVGRIMQGEDWRQVASDAADIIDAKNEEIGLLRDTLERIAYHPFASIRGEDQWQWMAESMRRAALNGLQSTPHSG